MTSEEYEAWRSKMVSEEYEEDQRALLLEARIAIRRAEYLLKLLVLSAARLADGAASDRPGDRKEQRVNHVYQRDRRKAI